MGVVLGRVSKRGGFGMDFKYIYDREGKISAIQIGIDHWRSVEAFIGKHARRIVSASLVVDDDENMRDLSNILSVAIRKSVAGWIPIIVSSPTSWVRINTSDVFNPFQDIVNWLECVVKNELPARVRIDEEGVEKVLVAESGNKKYIKFSVSDYDYFEGLSPDPFEDDLEYPRTYVKIYVNPSVLVRAFYVAIKTFFADRDNFSHWQSFGGDNHSLDFSRLEAALSEGLRGDV